MPDSVDQILTRLQPGKFDATRAARFDVEAARGVLTSSFAVERLLNFDPEARTADFAFATDQPIEHWFGMLTLDVSKKAVNLDRVEAGVCPFLVNHNTNDQVGVVMPGSIELGPIIRGKVKFSRSDRGQEIQNDVLDEIRNGTSIGFLVEDMQIENEKEVRKGAVPMYRATKWTMLENSVASIPADIAVGAGRSFQKDICPGGCGKTDRDCTCEVIATYEFDSPTRAHSTHTEKPMEKTAEQIAAEAAEAARAAAPAVETRSAEQIAVAEIREWAAELKVDEIATTYLRDCKLAETPIEPTKDGFFAAVRAAQPAPVVVPVENPQALALRQGGITPQHVQLARSVSRVQLKAFKGEGAYERAYRSGMHLAAVLLRDDDAVQYCRSHGISLSRVQGGTDNTKGGYTVLPEFEETIFELITQYGIARQNADVIPMTSDTKLVPRRVTGLTAYAVGPQQRGTQSTILDDAFELVARKWMVLAKYEDELSEDSFINWADRIASEASIAMAYAEDNSTFNGTGASTYHGIQGLIPKLGSATASLATAAGATLASVTAANLTTLIGLLPQFARKSGNVKFYCSHAVWANVLERLALAVGGVTYAEIKGELTPVFFGRQVEIVEVMSAAPATGEICLLYGNMTQSTTFGDRRGITVKQTDSNDTDFEYDLHAVKVTERFDVNNHDVGDTTNAGPMVALKLA